MKRLTAILMVLGLLLALGCENVTDPSSEVLDQTEDNAAELAKERADALEEQQELEQQRELEERVANYRVVLSKRSAEATFQGSKITVPDDFATVQDAINAAAPGTKIKIKDGHYTQALTITTDDLEISGEGDVILQGGITISNTSGVELTNLDIRRFGGSAAADAVIIVNSSDITIKDNIIFGADDGVRMNSSTECLIKGNTIEGRRGEGVKLNSGSDDNVVEENTITTGSASGDEGVELNSADNNEIADNVINAPSDDAIELNNSDGNEISGNIIDSPDYEGVDLDNSDNNEVKDNEISNAGDDGIEIDSASENNEIIKNVVCGSANQNIDNNDPTTVLKKNETGPCN